MNIGSAITLHQQLVWQRYPRLEQGLERLRGDSGQFQGHLTTYVSSDRVMLAYQGTDINALPRWQPVRAVLCGPRFMSREFRNSNVTADTTQFLGDLNALWLPGITRDSSFSGWTVFLFTLDQGGAARDYTSCFLHRTVALIVLGGSSREPLGRATRSLPYHGICPDRRELVLPFRSAKAGAPHRDRPGVGVERGSVGSAGHRTARHVSERARAETSGQKIPC